MHRGQAEPVEEAGLDVAREVRAGVHRREQRAWTNGTASANAKNELVGKPGIIVAGSSPPEFTASSAIGKTSAKKMLAAAGRSAPRNGAEVRHLRGENSHERAGSAVAFLLRGALESSPGLVEEDVVERRRVELQVRHLEPFAVQRADDLRQPVLRRRQPDRDAVRRRSRRLAEARETDTTAARSSGLAGTASIVGRPI